MRRKVQLVHPSINNQAQNTTNNIFPPVNPPPTNNNNPFANQNSNINTPVTNSNPFSNNQTGQILPPKPQGLNPFAKPSQPNTNFPGNKNTPNPFGIDKIKNNFKETILKTMFNHKIIKKINQLLNLLEPINFQD